MTPEEVARKKKRIQNKDSVSTERTITVGVGGHYINIPTIWDGKQLSKEESIIKARKRLGRYQKFNSISDAVKAARKRSEAIGEAIKKQ